MELCFYESIWCAVDVIVYFFAVVRCQSVSCVCQVFCYMAIDMMFRLVVCWNHIDGTWRCGGYLHMNRLTILSICHLHHVEGAGCGEFVANVYALKANSFVLLDRSAGFLFHGGLVGGNCASGTEEFVGGVSQSA